ncbi:MAG TPA: RING finger protein, partial [Chloroflexota bacterium]|nr:RING finger protein [Chloroflexota bacterium]
MMSETSAAPAVAAISIRTTAANSKWLNATCPKCQQPMTEGQQVVLCPKCYTPQHAQCWRDNDNKCAVDGTPARLIERAPRAGAAAGGAAAGAAPAAPAAPA